MARDRGEFMPRTQMLLYPVVGNDYNPEASPFESVRTNGTDYILTAQDMADYIDMYRSSVADLTNPYFAPLTAHDLSNQPRTLVLSAEYCPLRDEDEAYARRLQLVNDNVSCYRIHDGIHGYLLNTSAVGLVATTYRIIEHFLDGTPLEPAPGTGTTAWKVSTKDGEEVLMSGNAGKNYSSSTLTLTFTEDTHLSFEYKVSSEARYGKCTITLGSTTLVDGVSGNQEWKGLELDAKRWRGIGRS